MPVGGGGLLAGVAAAIKALRPGARVIGVEPAGAAKMSRSLAAGRPVTLESTASIADGLLPLRPGDLTFAHARALVDEVVTVDEDRLRDAVRYVAREARIVVEPSGAASVAAVLQRYGSAADVARPVVAILSGGNIALDADSRNPGGLITGASCIVHAASRILHHASCIVHLHCAFCIVHCAFNVPPPPPSIRRASGPLPRSS